MICRDWKAAWSVIVDGLSTLAARVRGSCGCGGGREFRGRGRDSHLGCLAEWYADSCRCARFWTRRSDRTSCPLSKESFSPARAACSVLQVKEAKVTMNLQRQRPRRTPFPPEIFPDCSSSAEPPGQRLSAWVCPLWDSSARSFLLYLTPPRRMKRGRRTGLSLQECLRHCSPR